MSPFHDKAIMDFQELCTLDSFKEVWGYYGYSESLRDVIERDFTRIKGLTYLDHAAAALYPESLTRAFCHDITTNVYGNPHSHSPCSILTHDTIERVRFRVLQHFNTTPEEYCVIFISGCTAALKLVAESFPWSPQTATHGASHFCYLTDNHTSVVGIRALAAACGATDLAVLPQDVESRAKREAVDRDGACQTPHLFCYPAQSNFSGRKYPLGHVAGIQARRLYPACDMEGRWFVLLDAASLVSCSALDLQECPADFIPVSFYKMFGFPTGLGALLVRTDTAKLLRKTYFGGGTAAAYLAGEDYYVPTANISDRFEDGTISFLDIIALNHGFESLYKITGGMHNIQLHTFGLARYTYMLLSSLRHGNGRPAAQLYTEGQFESPSTQGAILNFNLLDCHGRMVGYTQVDKLASLHNIHLRTGCFCNTGACQHFLGISNNEIKRNLQAGHVCGDRIDMVDGRATGSVRVSFGYTSTFEDCQNFLNFVVDCFVEKPVGVDHIRLQTLKIASDSNQDHPEKIFSPVDGRHNPLKSQEGHRGVLMTGKAKEGREPYTLTNIYIYPIKSCGALEVLDWPVGPLGLLYDRAWMVVNVNGVCLSQKREPRLCLIQPQVHLASNTLLLQASGMDTMSVPLENLSLGTSQRVCQSKVCGDRVQTVDCGDEAASWLSEFLAQSCRLIKQSTDFTRGAKSAALSLVNEAQYLMINRASVELIQEHIRSRKDPSEDLQLLDTQNLIGRFRANLVISGMKPFEEDNWSHLIIGKTRFVVSGRCERCQMIGVNQDTATKSKVPLLALSACRPGKVTFGVYLRHLLQENKSTSLSVGAVTLQGQDLSV